jgi:hypothetical protein
MKKEHAFLIGFRFPSSVWVKFDLGWIGLRLAVCYFRRGKKVAND